MEKLKTILKPYFNLILGVLLFLFYLNWLQNDGAWLALGIIAIIFACYYVVSGLLLVLIGEKLSTGVKNVFDILSISCLPLILFVTYIVLFTQTKGNIAPAGWVVGLTALISTLAASIFFVLAKLTNKPVLVKLATLFAFLLLLVLLLNTILDADGDSLNIGQINILRLSIYVFYTLVLIDSLLEFKKD